jgi:hypothetical protein
MKLLSASTSASHRAALGSIRSVPSLRLSEMMLVSSRYISRQGRVYLPRCSSAVAPNRNLAQRHAFERFLDDVGLASTAARQPAQQCRRAFGADGNRRLAAACGLAHFMSFNANVYHCTCTYASTRRNTLYFVILNSFQDNAQPPFVILKQVQDDDGLNSRDRPKPLEM